MLPLILKYWKILAIVIVMAGCVGVGYKWRSYQADQDALKLEVAKNDAIRDAEKKRDAQEKAWAAKSVDLENQLAELRKSKQKVQIVREKVYAKEGVFKSCIVPVDGVQLINERIGEREPVANTGKR